MLILRINFRKLALSNQKRTPMRLICTWLLLFLYFFFLPITLVKAQTIRDTTQVIHEVAVMRTDSLAASAQYPTIANSSVQEKDSAVLPSENAFYITDIRLKGAKFMRGGTKKRLLAPYLNTHMSASSISALVKDLQNYYLNKGYTTTQVNVPLGQNLKQGTLEIVVAIGFIEEILLNLQFPRDKGKIATAFLKYKNKPFYLPYIEQGIDQINQVNSSNAVLKILPGLQEGGSVILIDQVTTYPVLCDIGTDNLGSKKTGIWRWKFHFLFDNLLSINDNFALYYDTNYAKENVKKIKFRQHSLLMSLSFPLSYFTVSAEHTLQSSISPIGKKQAVNYYKKNSYNQKYKVNMSLYKSKLYKGDAYIAFYHDFDHQYVKDTPLHASSGKQNKMEIGLVFNGLLWKGQYIIDIIYGHSFPWQGLYPTPPPIPNQPIPTFNDRTFNKISYHLNWVRPFSIFNQFLNYHFSLTGQFRLQKNQADNVKEKFYLLGFGQVRGFKGDFSDDKGFYCRQEISWHNCLPFSKWLKPFQLLAGLDAGYLFNTALPHKKKKPAPLQLFTWIGGIRYHASWLNADITYARPISASQYWSKDIKRNPKWYLNFTIKLHQLLLTGK